MSLEHVKVKQMVKQMVKRTERSMEKRKGFCSLSWKLSAALQLEPELQ